MHRLKENKILLAHGDGGLLTHELIKNLILKHLPDQIPEQLNDAAIIPVPAGRIAFTTDSFVADPIFFPGGDLGKLAVCGTVNDLAVSGALPRYLSVSFILEEGLDITELEKLVVSIAESAKTAGVKVVTGDTKVVERGNADKIYINTTGIGFIPPGTQLGYEQVKPGDVLIINGNIGEHGIAVLSKRQELDFESPVESDCAALNHLIKDLVDNFKTIKFMRDPTRGGLATTVKEMALSCKCDIFLFEQNIPVSPAVAGAAEMLGLDPLYLANEGKVIIIASPQEGEKIVARMRSHDLGKEAAIAGEVREGRGNVYLKTFIGGTRLIDMLSGQQLPRIC